MEAYRETLPLFIVVMNMLFVLFTLSVERKNSALAASWILLLIFLPVIGFILYLIFGTNIFIRKQTMFKNKLKADKELAANYVSLLPAKHNQAELILEMADFNQRLKGRSLTCNNEAAIFFSAEEKYCALLNDIERAVEHIHMQYFIFRNDLIGRLILGALARKARLGVKVRILYDHGGSIFTPSEAFNSLRNAGAEVVAFMPIKSSNYIRVNFRNHRKLVIIDGRLAYIGGMNIGDEYMSRYKKQKIKWRDTHMRLIGDSIAYMQLQFIQDWQFATGRSIPEHCQLFKAGLTKNKMLVDIISSGPDTAEAEIKWNFMKLIYSAQTEILIQTPYFVPDESFMEALKIAALSGCRIRIMLPAVSDNYIVQTVSFDYVGELLEYGVEVIIYDGFLHAKMLVVDDNVVSIGSTNMDMRSFELNFELNAFIYDKKIAAVCRRQFELDGRGAKMYELAAYRQRSLAKRIQVGVFRLLAPLM